MCLFYGENRLPVYFQQHGSSFRHCLHAARGAALRARHWFDLLTDVKMLPGLIAGEALIS